MSTKFPRRPGDPWQHLRRFTEARIALGRAGVSLPTAPTLAFAAAHAAARDAIHVILPVAELVRGVESLGLSALVVRSAAHDRTQYLLRPDLGRRLDSAAQAELAAAAAPDSGDLCLVVADGLSALAIERHALPLIEAILGAIGATRVMAPLVIAHQARVALGDAIALSLRARMVAVIIGERPGLSAADSLGIYFTYAPAIATPDARRNCISNIRTGGSSYAAAADKLRYLITRATALGLSGVQLKDDAIEAVAGNAISGMSGNFLLPQ